METFGKAIFKRLTSFLVVFMNKTSIGRYLSGEIINEAMSLTQNVEYQGLNFVFLSPNTFNKFRADTFSTKEPEIRWVRDFVGMDLRKLMGRR